MALMKFREGNRVKWIGSKPGHDGTQVFTSFPATNATAIVYTVPVGSVLYLVESFLGVTAIAAGYVVLQIQNAGGAFVRHLCFIQVGAAAPVHDSHFTAWPPVELPAGFTIRVQSSAVGLTAYGAIFGWVE